MNNFMLDNIYNFISECNNTAHISYEPYIDENTTAFFEENTSSPILSKDNFKLIKDNTGTLLCLTSKDTLIGLCSVFEYESNSDIICELSLLVAPEYRFHHIGSALLNYQLLAIEKTHSDATILLVGSNQAFAEHNGFIFSHSEHFMYRSDNSSYNLPDNMHISHKGANLKDVTYRLHANGISVAKCHIYDAGLYLNLSHVYTNKKYRGKGYAGMLINAIASLYPAKSLLLQVSGANISAIRAYTKIGFAFLNTTDYYILED